MELNKTFIDGLWSKEINVSDFVSKTTSSYHRRRIFHCRTNGAHQAYLEPLSESTGRRKRANNGVRSLDHTTVSTITSHKAGYR